MEDKQYRHILGENPELVEFEGRTDLQELALEMVSQARQTLDIFTQDLEPHVYNTRGFARAVSELASRSRFSEIRILVKDPERSIKSGHQLIETVRKFTSFIKVRRLHKEYHDHIEAFLVVDKRGLIYRKNADHYIGYANFNDPLRSRDLTRFFTEAWEVSEPEHEIRALHI